MDRSGAPSVAAEIGQPVGEQACPSCGAPIPVLRGYSPWCDACDWNLAPTEAPQKTSSKRDQLLERTAGRLSEGRFEAIRRRSADKPGFSIAQALIFAVSIIVLALTLFLLIAGIWLLLNGPGFVGPIVGVILIGIAIVLRPRFGSMPPSVTRQDASELFGVPDAVAASIGVRPADRIAITSDFNAAVTEIGLRRQRVLFLGLPLMAVLSPQERVAVLGHEFGHYANGDPLRGTVPSLAIETLIGWYQLLRPEGIASSPDGDAFHGLVLIPVNVVLLVLSHIPVALAYAIYWLTAQDGQRAEFYADRLAVRLSGRDAFVSAWTKMHLGRTVAAWTRASTDEHWLNQSLWEELEARVAGFPERELDRARRLELVQKARIDATHPPTYLRIRLAEEVGPENGSIEISEQASADFDAILRRAAPEVQQALIDQHTSSLYAS